MFTVERHFDEIWDTVYSLFLVIPFFWNAHPVRGLDFEFVGRDRTSGLPVFRRLAKFGVQTEKGVAVFHFWVFFTREIYWVQSY